MSRRKAKPTIDREARRAWLEAIIQRDGCSERRRWAAGELGRLWAEEALEEIKEKIAAIP